MNIDDSSRGNPRHARIGGIGRNSAAGEVMFFFPIYKWQLTNKLIKGPCYFICSQKEVVPLDGNRLFLNLIHKLWWIC